MINSMEKERQTIRMTRSAIVRDPHSAQFFLVVLSRSVPLEGWLDAPIARRQNKAMPFHSSLSLSLRSFRGGVKIVLAGLSILR